MAHGMIQASTIGKSMVGKDQGPFRSNVDGPPSRLCGSGEKVMSMENGGMGKAISVHSATMSHPPELKDMATSFSTSSRLP